MIRALAWLALTTCASHQSVEPSSVTVATSASASASETEAAPSSTFFAQSVATVGPPEEKCDGKMICVQGRIVPEVIQRIIHLNRARFRECYADARRRNPSASGRVVVRFRIERTGDVRDASIVPEGTTLADPDLGTCLVKAFEALSFPQPEGGAVTVTYPMVFTPTWP